MKTRPLVVCNPPKKIIKTNTALVFIYSTFRENQSRFFYLISVNRTLPLRKHTGVIKCEVKFTFYGYIFCFVWWKIELLSMKLSQ